MTHNDRSKIGTQRFADSHREEKIDREEKQEPDKRKSSGKRNKYSTTRWPLQQGGTVSRRWKNEGAPPSGPPPLFVLPCRGGAWFQCGELLCIQAQAQCSQSRQLSNVLPPHPSGNSNYAMVWAAWW